MSAIVIVDLIFSVAIFLLIGVNIVLMRRLYNAIGGLQALAVNVVTFSPNQKPRLAGKVDLRHGPTTGAGGGRGRGYVHTTGSGGPDA